MSNYPHTTGVRLLMIPVAITIGMYAFGLIGTIISIPIAGCIKVLIDEYSAMKDAYSESN